MWANYIGVMNESAWEEEAFAEDGRGPLVWPPSSYSCSFCTRKFRSAQALGGHMNIHRRERAKLRQSLNSTTYNYPPQNPNSSKSPNPSFSSSPNSSRVSLSQRSCYNSADDTRNTSCVSSLDQGTYVETNFNLGFRLDLNTTNHHHHRGFGHDDGDVMNCKRQKTAIMPLIVGSIVEEVDLELRLAT